MSRNGYARIPVSDDSVFDLPGDGQPNRPSGTCTAISWRSPRNALRIAALCSVVVVSYCIPSLRSPGVPKPADPPASAQSAAVKSNVCERIIVHNFDNAWGFGSEFSIFLHAAALSEHIGYTVLANTRKWIYGDLSEFWMPVPPPSGCELPQDALDTTNSKWFSYGNWSLYDRVVMWRDQPQLRALDTLVRHFSIDTRLTAELREREKLYRLMTDRLVLPYGESVPVGVLTAFREQAATLKRLWIPNAQMQAQIDRLASRIGLHGHDGRPRGGDMRPVIAVQIRLGDKKTEQKDVLQAGSHMAFDDLNVYFDACQLALEILYDKTLTPPPRTFIPHNNTRPLLVVMSAEVGIVEKLEELDKKRQFDIILSPSFEGEFTPEQEVEYTQIFFPPPQTSTASNSASVTAASMPATISSAQTITTSATATTTTALTATTAIQLDHASQQRRWQQGMLYKASHGLRLALTRQLIAELTVYSRMTDGFIVSGNSNLGRLAQLLAGEDGAVSHDGKPERVRSIDVPFYPTLYRNGIFPP